MPGRTQSSTIGGYKYAHNGQEKDNEIFDGALTAEFWEYDSRIGRRWEMDPLTYEWQSPYAAFNNNPISYADPLGLRGDDKGNGGRPKAEAGKTHADHHQGPAEGRGHNTRGDGASQHNQHRGQDASRVASNENLGSGNPQTSTTTQKQPTQQKVEKKSEPLAKTQTTTYIKTAETSTKGSNTAYLNAYGKGLANALTSGAAFGIGSKNPDEAFPDNLTLQTAYAQGRLAGDAILTLIGTGAIADGASIGAGTTALLMAETGTGIGIVIAPETAIGGYLTAAVTSGYGAVVIKIATSDAIETNAWLARHQMVGGGQQTASKTLWKGSGKERIDVENPNPGQRPGNIHFQDNKGNKYIYDPVNNIFKGASKKVNEILLKNPGIKTAIEKGKKYLGI